MHDENKRSGVNFERPTMISGRYVEKEEVYPFQKRHMVEAGVVKGGVEDIASEGEKAAGALNVLKRAEDRDDMDIFSVQKAHEEGWGYGDIESKKSAKNK